MKNFHTSDEKLLKAKVIDGMLTELNMSKEELIELIKSLTAPSVGQEAEYEVETNEPGLVDLLNDEDMTVEEIALQISEHNLDFLGKFLSLVDLRKLLVRITFAISLKRLHESGVLQEVEQKVVVNGLANLHANASLQPNGSYKDESGRELQLKLEILDQMNDDILRVAQNPVIARSTYEGMQLANQVAQFLNDPNSLNNPNSSTSVVNRVMSSVRMQVQSMGAAVDAMSTSVGAVQQVRQQQQQQQNMQSQARSMQRAFSSMFKHDKKIKSTFPDVQTTRVGKNKEVFATVKTKSGSKEVNLKDYLKETNRLSPAAEKLLDKLSEGSSKLLHGADALSKGLPKVGAFRFDASGKLQAKEKGKHTTKMVNIEDYINDLKRDLAKAKTENRREEGKNQKVELAKQTARGPEMERSIVETAKMQAESNATMKMLTMAPDAGEAKEYKKLTESAQNVDDLNKIDAAVSKANLMDNFKGLHEVKEIESSMKEVMKGMTEAEQNKDLVKEMRKEREAFIRSKTDK